MTHITSGCFQREKLIEVFSFFFYVKHRVIQPPLHTFFRNVINMYIFFALVDVYKFNANEILSWSGTINTTDSVRFIAWMKKNCHSKNEMRNKKKKKRKKYHLLWHANSAHAFPFFLWRNSILFLRFFFFSFV